MANLRISSLTLGSAVASTDVFPMVETTGVGPVKKTGAQLLTFIQANLSVSVGSIGGLGTGVATALAAAAGGAGGFALFGALGSLASLNTINNANWSGTVLAVSNGGTGTATPGLVAGTNVTITGTWPNQTINSSGGGSMAIGGTITGSPTAGYGLYVNGSTLGQFQYGANVFSALSAGLNGSGGLVGYSGAFGTPSTINLTNGTGLPISGLTGLGTGVGTALGNAAGASGGFALFSSLGSLASLSSVNNSNWSGTALAATNGGTAQSAYVTGDILYASATNTLSRLAAGTNTYVLTLAGGVPTWAAPSGGGSGTVSSGTTNTLAFYASNGTTVGPLTLGTNLSITGSTLNAAGGGGTLTVGTTATSGGASGQIMFDGGALLQESVNLLYASSILQVGQSTTSQSFRVANTWSSSGTNYEYGVFDWQTTANTLTIGTTNGGTGLARNLQFVVGGANKLDYGITNSGAWTFATAVNFPNVISGVFATPANNSYMSDANGVIVAYNVPVSFRSTGQGAPDSGISRISAGVLGIGNGTSADVSGTLSLKSVITGALTFSTLPASPTAGQRAYITDSNTAVFLATAAGGGSNKVPVLYNGTAWVVA